MEPTDRVGDAPPGRGEPSAERLRAGQSQFGDRIDREEDDAHGQRRNGEFGPIDDGDDEREYTHHSDDDLGEFRDRIVRIREHYSG